MRATRPGESALLLLDVVDVLTNQKIEYAVIGALAASVHGAVRASMDADVVLSIGLPEAKNFGDVLTRAGFQIDLARGDADDPIPALLKITDAHGNRVDMLIGLRGLDPMAFSRTIDIAFQGQTLKFVGREDFIAMKIFAGGPMDLLDASRAITAGGASIDLDLVHSLARRFGVDASQTLNRLLREQTR
jgi:predicted nucleotidyltransferase